MKEAGVIEAASGQGGGRNHQGAEVLHSRFTVTVETVRKHGDKFVRQTEQFLAPRKNAPLVDCMLAGVAFEDLSASDANVWMECSSFEQEVATRKAVERSASSRTRRERARA